MSKFVKRSKKEVLDDYSSSSDEEILGEKITDILFMPPEPKEKPYEKDLGIVKFKNQKMYVGKKYVSFADDNVYKASAKHFYKDIDEELEGEIDVCDLDEKQKSQLKRKLKRGKYLITHHPDYDHEDGVLPSTDEYNYTNPVAFKTTKKKEAIEINGHVDQEFLDKLNGLEKRFDDYDTKFVTFQQRFDEKLNASVNNQGTSISELRKYYGFD